MPLRQRATGRSPLRDVPDRHPNPPPEREGTRLADREDFVAVAVDDLDDDSVDGGVNGRLLVAESRGQRGFVYLGEEGPVLG